MSFFALLAALVCFLIAGLASLFGWNLGDFNAIAWGLFSLALAFILGHDRVTSRLGA